LAPSGAAARRTRARRPRQPLAAAVAFQQPRRHLFRLVDNRGLPRRRSLHPSKWGARVTWHVFGVLGGAGMCISESRSSHPPAARDACAARTKSTGAVARAESAGRCACRERVRVAQRGAHRGQWRLCMCVCTVSSRAHTYTCTCRICRVIETITTTIICYRSRVTDEIVYP